MVKAELISQLVVRRLVVGRGGIEGKKRSLSVLAARSLSLLFMLVLFLLDCGVLLNLLAAVLAWVLFFLVSLSVHGWFCSCVMLKAGGLIGIESHALLAKTTKRKQKYRMSYVCGLAHMNL